jgi:hypothetical protein
MLLIKLIVMDLLSRLNLIYILHLHNESYFNFGILHLLNGLIDIMIFYSSFKSCYLN